MRSTMWLAATAGVALAAGMAQAQDAAVNLDELYAAAQAEGMLTTIALPHDWCNYGAMIEGFKAKYPGIEVNELNPDAGSADEATSSKADISNADMRSNISSERFPVRVRPQS